MSFNKYGTGIIYFSPSDTKYTQIPGMDTTVNVPANCTVIVQSTGSVYASEYSAYISMMLGLYVDDVLQPKSASRLSFTTDDNLTGSGGNWTLNYPIQLSPGLHKFSIKVKAHPQNQTSFTIDNRGIFGLSMMTLTYLKK